MKYLWLSIFFSVGIHAIFFGLDMSWVKNALPVTPKPSHITITLVPLQPPEEKKTPAVAKLPANVEETPNIPEEEPPESQVIQPIPPPPVEQKSITKPPAPAAEAFPQQMTEKEPDPEKEKPQKKVKPKRSLKKLTKKKQKTLSGYIK